MKILTALFFLIQISSFSLSQEVIVGLWTTIDDNSGRERSVVEIYERDSQYFGRVVKMMLEPHEDPDPVCDLCDKEDKRYMQKVLGMEILLGLEKDDDEFSGGEILDPENGKVYRCKLWIEDGKLKLRGYVLFFYRTQTWKKFEGHLD